MAFRQVFPKAQVAALLARGHVDQGIADLLDAHHPLKQTFEQAFVAERTRKPNLDRELSVWFDRCGDPSKSVDDLVGILRTLRPGGPFVGVRQVADLAEHSRRTVHRRLDRRWGRWWNARPGKPFGRRWTVGPHDHALGSGGDLFKTTHATTGASILVAPLCPICKTVTQPVTSPHGSVQAALAFGHPPATADLVELRRKLRETGLVFLPLKELGLPYSPALVAAREQFWQESIRMLPSTESPAQGWHDVLRTWPAQIDIFKVVTPNADFLRAAHHSTGIYHLSLLPYVLAIYLRLGLRGLIMHGYDGIDEVSTASSDMRPGTPTTLVVRVEDTQVSIAEFGPEDLGLPRARLRDIKVTADVGEEAATFRALQAGATGPHRDFIVANAGALLAAGGRATNEDSLVNDLRTGVLRASELLPPQPDRATGEGARLRAAIPHARSATGSSETEVGTES